MRKVTVVIASMAMVAVSVPAVAQSPPQRPELQPVVVQLSNELPDPAAFARGLTSRHGGDVGFVYQHAVKGFSAELPQPAIDALSRNPSVLAVTPDRVVVSIDATALDIPTGYDRIEADLANPSPSVVDVDIAILDTGVKIGHPDLNVHMATDCTASFFGACAADGDLDDGHGHGSHVAGISAARFDGAGTTGVAPGARIWSVKVLDSQGNGLLSWLLAGVDAVTQHADKIDVANMSLAGQFSDQTFDTAIANSVAAGVFYAAAAGNSATDAASFSPANHPDVMSVSAVADGDGAAGGLGAFGCRDGENDDWFASFSNFGSVVDIAAPGVCIYSAWNDGGYRMASGTSMASPYVAGAAALYIAGTGRDQDDSGTVDGADVEAVRHALLADALPQDHSCGFGGDPDSHAEPLLFVNGAAFGGDGSCTVAVPDSTGPPAPTVSATSDGFNVDLAWTGAEDPETGILSYLVERDGEPIAEVDAHTTGYSDTGLAPSTTHVYTVTATNRQGVAGDSGGDSATTSSDDPSQIGHWAMDDGSGTVASDSSGWRRHGTLVNGPTWTAGTNGGALGFDGADDRVDLDPASLHGADNVTAAFWLRTTETGAQTIVSGANASNSNEYTIYLVNDTTLRFYVGTAENEGVQWDIPSIADGQWHHLAVVRNSGPEHTYLYLNGSYFGGWQVTKAMDPVDVTGLVLGQDQDTVGGGFDPNEALHADLDDFQLHARVLSETEIAALASQVGNTPPTALDDSASADEDAAVTVDVLANDTDADSDPLAVTSTTDPANGTATINADNTITYAPDPDYNGTDTFTYTISDGNDGTATATVTVTINPVNDAPTANAGADQTATVGDTVMLDGSGSSDIDGDTLTYSWSITQAPDGSTATLENPASVSPQFTPDVDGDYVVELVVNDSTVDSEPDTVTVTATDANTPPTALDDSAVTDEDTPVTVDVLANDTDADSDPLAVTSVTDPANGTATINADNTITYAPDPDYNGTDTFTYTISDGNGGTDTATVTITINPVDDTSIIHLAESETTLTGTSSGDLTDTHVEDGSVEELTESHSGGRPQSRVSALEHRWTFSVQSGESINVAAVAHRSAGSEDDFVFEYSTDGGATFAPLFTVSSETPASHEAALSSSTSGQVIVRVMDTDRTVGNGTTDSVFVDWLSIETMNPDPAPPTTSYEFRAVAETTVRGQVSSGDYTSTFTADSVYEVIEEELYAGNRKSRLEHRWTFETIQTGLTFHLLADRIDPVAETLAFEYSTDGSTWVPMTLSLDGTQQVLVLPAELTGTIYVRVIDTDQSRNENNVDAVRVDEMYFSTTS